MAWWNFRRKAIVCRRAVELVTDYLEGALPAGDRERLEAHLEAEVSELGCQLQMSPERPSPQSVSLLHVSFGVWQ